MKKCLICGCMTEGSTGVSGLHWKSICQPCKDESDFEAGQQVKELARAMKTFIPDEFCGPRDPRKDSTLIVIPTTWN